MLIYCLCVMQTVSLAILVFGLSRYIKINHYVNIIANSLRRFKMDSETNHLIDELLAQQMAKLLVLK